MTDQTFSATQLADRLGLPKPTDQQVRVIESELAPALVIAGAGSGKTETMASRVVWLLANGYVEPGEVLGLTFTRKAAGQLASRIRERIAGLASAGILSRDLDEFDPPVVSTYNSFANSIFRDNAILLGRDADGSVLGEASAWQLARSVVMASRDRRLDDLDESLDRVTNAVLSLSHELSENVVDVDRVREMAERFAALAELPTGGTGQYQKALDIVGSVSTLPLLLDLATDFSNAKAARGFVEYADQVMLALQSVRAVDRVGADVRERFKVVLLDEYQDTSVVQTWLLTELFGGHPVMAVGDPNQSIYGWRGASSANLTEFLTGFRGESDVQEFPLSTSWRNGHCILAAANRLVEPLEAESTVLVTELTAPESATAFPIDVSYSETIEEEARASALWLKGQLTAPGATPPSAAMLFRARRTQRVFVEALREAGVPFHVLGIGGLLDEPDVADLVCALTVVNDPSAGSQLVRLLAGSRWRIGVRDLHALSRVAFWLKERDHSHQALADSVRERMRASVAEDVAGSIVEALDFVSRAKPDHSELRRFSPLGLERLRDAGAVFSRLRARASLDLPDFVTLVEQEFRLDIEVLANDSRPSGGASMEAFFDAINSFRAVNEGGGLGGFLGWLREAVVRDDLAPRPEDPEPGTVQLLTIHGAKGLEWDLVVVPRMVSDELPAKPRESNGWTGFGKLPFEFRGDSESLPDFDWHGAESRKDLLARHERFKDDVKTRHEREERRLAYVAVTRARHRLLLSGSFWSSQAGYRVPSRFLSELAEAGIIDELPDSPIESEKPEGAAASPVSWPADPLGNRRGKVTEAAARVRAATASSRGRRERDLELLLAERSRLLSATDVVPVPARVPASRFKDFVTDPADVAASIRRPMPEKPFRATRLGTLFHSWVEERSGLGGSLESVDAQRSENDLEFSPLDEAELARLQQIFEHSEWAGLKPVEVERELHLPFDGHVVICKIDAVYFVDGRYRIVDWKTGKAPSTPAELAQRQLQLALYRLAFAAWKGIAPEEIDAVFYYVAENRTIAPERLYGDEELLSLWRKATRPTVEGATAPVDP